MERFSASVSLFFEDIHQLLDAPAPKQGQHTSLAFPPAPLLGDPLATQQFFSSSQKGGD
jgi:hypothetical protein